MSWCKFDLAWRDLKNVIVRTFVYDFQFVCSHRRVRVPWPCRSVSVQGRWWSGIRFRICTRPELCGVEKLPTELHSRQAPILLHLTHHYGHPELTVKDAHTVRGLSGGKREWFVSKRHSYRYMHIVQFSLLVSLPLSLSKTWDLAFQKSCINFQGARYLAFQQLDLS